MLMGILLCLLAGCGKKESVEEEADKNTYYENSLVFQVADKYDSFSLIGMGKENFYYYTREVIESEEDIGEELCFYKQALERGSKPVSLKISVGNLLLRNARIFTDNAGKESIVLLLGEEQEGELQYALYEYDTEGKQVNTMLLPSTGIQGDYPEQFCRLQDGGYMVVSKRYLYRVDVEGNISFSHPCPGVEYIALSDEAEKRVGLTYLQADGKVCLCFVDYSGQKVASTVNISGSGNLICMDAEGAFYIDEKGIRKYAFSEQADTSVLELVGRNITAYQIISLKGRTGEFYLFGYSADGRAAKYITYTPKTEGSTGIEEGEDAQNPEKYDAYGRRYIYLYDFTGDWPKYSENPIDAFNEQSDSYQVVVKDYAYGEMDIHKIVARGEYPDLICSEYNSLIAGFLEKGILEDLKPYVRTSENLSLDGLSEPIVNAYTEDGVLFGLPNTFELRALYGPKQYLGEPGWTVEEYLDWLFIHPSPGAMATRNAILDSCMPALLEQYVDWEKGEAYFDSEGFCVTISKLKALNRVKEFTKEEAVLNKELYEMDESALDFSIPNPSAYIYFAEETRGVDMVVKGYPSVDGTPVAYIEAGALSIMSTSEVKEGAYEFLEFYLLYRTEELSSHINGSSRFWTVKQRQQEDFEGLLEADNYLGWSCSYSEEQLEEIMNMIPYACLRDYSNREREELIKEELEPFFEGQKDAETVSRIIQGRVKVYLDEREGK